MTDLVRDPGLQQERTRLAWRRTTLALAVATLIIGRLTFTTVGLPVILPVVVATAGALWVLVTLSRRRGAEHPLEPSFSTLLRDGRLPAVVAGITVMLCLTEIGSVVARMLST